MELRYSFPGALSFSRMIPSLLVLLILHSQPQAIAQDSPGGKIRVSGDNLTPGSTLRVQFDVPVIEPSRIGFSPEELPLTITPAVPGKFTWESVRSGTFTPSEPFQIGQQYEFRMEAQTLEAEPRQIVLEHTLKTPGLKVNGTYPYETGSQPTSDLYSQPRVLALFNEAVDPARVAESAQFVNDEGQIVRAEVSRADDEDQFPSWKSETNSLLTWSEQFTKLKEDPAESDRESADLVGQIQPDKLSTRENLVAIQPAQPLRPAKEWKLMIVSGVPATNVPVNLEEGFELELGSVKPFEVTNIEAINILNRPKTIDLTLSKSMPREFTEEKNAAAPYIEISPEPSDFSVASFGATVSLRGDFEVNKDYQVTVKPGLPSIQPGFGEMTAGKTETVRFEPLPPRLYLPVFETYQQANGNREIRILDLNLPNFRIKAKKLQAPELIQALTAYERYRKPWNESQDGLEPFRGLDYQLMPGTEIYHQVYEGSAKIDEVGTTVLNWNEVLGEGGTGGIFLNVEDREGSTVGAQAVVQVTDLGIVWKHDGRELHGYVFSLRSGQPVSGAKVTLRDANGSELISSQTDTSGLARMPLSQSAQWVTAETGDDVLAQKFGLTNYTLSSWQFGVDFSPYHSAPQDYRFEVFTDRGVYKPGETAYLKGIVRRWTGSTMGIPNDTVNIKVRDAKWETIIDENVSLSQYGTFDLAFELPDSNIGRYSINISSGEANAYHSFLVQEFEPNAFEVHTPSSRDLEGIGEELTIEGSANYYNGANLSNAEVKWTVDVYGSSFYPEGYDGFSFANYVRYASDLDLDLNVAFTNQGELKIGESGKFSFSPEITFNPRAPQPVFCSATAEITDVNQQLVTETIEFTRHSSDFYLGVSEFPEAIAAGEEVEVHFVAANSMTEKPVNEPVEIQVTLQRVAWETVHYRTAGGASAYKNRAVFGEEMTQTVRTSPLVEVNGLRSVAPDTPPVKLSVPEEGTWIIRAQTKDSAGRDVVLWNTIEVKGENPYPAAYRSPVTLQLVPDKEQYTAGDTARILVRTPIKGHALVTMEREGVQSISVQLLEEGDTFLEIPISAEMSPNVAVSVLQIRGAADSTYQIEMPHYRYGYCELKVMDPAKKLTVQVSSENESYLPGQPVKIAALVTDNQQQPVPAAEVTLYAVDEGVLSLTDYQTPDPFELFYQSVPLQVRTVLSLPDLFREAPVALSYGNKGYLIGGGGDGPMPEVRKDFKANALWQARLITDANGRVTGEFTAPDNLTEFRLIAVVNTREAQFGSDDSPVTVTKPVMINPALPRFANVGDRLVLRGIVNNQTDQLRQIEVVAEFDDRVRVLDGLDYSAPLFAQIAAISRSGEGQTFRRTIEVAAKGQEVVSVPVEVLREGEAVWTWRATDTSEGAFRDAVETRLGIEYPMPLLREIHWDVITAQSQDLLTDVNPALLEGKGEVFVQASNTRAVQLNEGLDYVLDYPYGCLEQTTSRVLPWLAIDDMRQIFPQMAEASDEKVKRVITDAVDTLVSMQTPSGGLAFWPGGREPFLWGSAYGGIALAMADQQGYEVPEASLNTLASYLSREMRSVSKFEHDYELSTRCLAAYTLTLLGKGEPAYHDLLYDKREYLSRDSLCFLALAMIQDQGTDPRAEELLAIAANRPDMPRYWFGSYVRDLALQLLCWSKLEPNGDRADELADELMQARGPRHWGTTQDNLWTFLAMADYLKATEAAQADQIRAKFVADAREMPFILTKEARSIDEKFTFEQGSGNLTKLLLEKDPQGKIFTYLKAEAVPQLQEMPAQSNGIQISRFYNEIQDDGTLTGTDDLQVGDRVLVTLKVSTGEFAPWVALDDPLPSILEPVNPSFATQRSAAADAVSWNWGFRSHRETRTTRMLFFDDRLYPGEYEVTYLARVRADGVAMAPQAKVELMYKPQVFGLTKSELLRTKPEQIAQVQP